MVKIIIIAERRYPPVSRSNLRTVKIAELLSRKHEVIFIHGGDKTKRFTNIKFEAVPFKEDKGFMEFPSRLRYAKKVRDYVMKYHSDADYVIGWNFVPNYACYLISKRLHHVKYICDMTDFGWDFFYATHPQWYYRPFVKWIEYMECVKFPKKADKVVVVSQFMKQHLSGHYNIHHKKIHVMPDGVEPSFKATKTKTAMRKKLKLTRKNKVIVYLGDAEIYDGLDLLCGAFHYIALIDVNVRLLIIGDGRKYFKELISKLLNSPIQDKVICTGWVNRSEVPNYLQVGDVAVIPSRKRLSTDAIYTFKMFEFFNLGLPVLASDLETIKTVINRKLGYVYNDLYAGLCYILQNNFKPDKKELIRVRKTFRWSNTLTEYSDIVK